MIKRVKRYFAPERRMIRHLQKVRKIAGDNHFTVMPGLMTDVIADLNAFYVSEGNPKQWCVHREASLCDCCIEEANKY